MNLYKAIDKVKKYNYDLDNLLINVPRKNYYNILYIKNISNEILEHLIIYSYSKNHEYLKKTVVKVNILDYNISKLYKNKYISNKLLITSINDLREIYYLLYKLLG